MVAQACLDGCKQRRRAAGFFSAEVVADVFERSASGSRGHKAVRRERSGKMDIVLGAHN